MQQSILLAFKIISPCGCNAVAFNGHIQKWHLTLRHDHIKIPFKQHRIKYE